MKNIFIASLVLASAVAAQAQMSDYSCQSLDGTTKASLQRVGRKTILWVDHSHSASSKGVFAGVDSAPYSERKGQLQFKLVDYFATEDQQFVLSIPKTFSQNPDQLNVTEFFDNDDHAEGETEFRCIKVK